MLKKDNGMNKILKNGFVLLINDIKNARWAIMIIIAYFVFGNKILHSVCPLTWLTGFPCPACGLTRAGLCLLRLDFKGAWEMHPFIYVFLILAFIFGWNRYICQKKNRNPEKVILIVTIIWMLVFYLWRMYRFYPQVPPMTYNPDNLIRLAAITFGIVKK